VQAGVVEPPKPFQGGDFDFIDGAPWLADLDQLNFEQSVDCFGQGVVLRVFDGTVGCFDS